MTLDFLSIKLAFEYGTSSNLEKVITNKNPTSYEEINLMLKQLLEEYFEVRFNLKFPDLTLFSKDTLEIGKYLNNIIFQNAHLLSQEVFEFDHLHNYLYRHIPANRQNNFKIYKDIYYPMNARGLNSILNSNNSLGTQFSPLFLKNPKFNKFLSGYGLIKDNCFLINSFEHHKLPLNETMKVEIKDFKDNIFLSESVKYSVHSQSGGNYYYLTLDKSLSLVIPKDSGFVASDKLKTCFTKPNGDVLEIENSVKIGNVYAYNQESIWHLNATNHLIETQNHYILHLNLFTFNQDPSHTRAKFFSEKIFNGCQSLSSSLFLKSKKIKLIKD